MKLNISNILIINLKSFNNDISNSHQKAKVVVSIHGYCFTNWVFSLLGQESKSILGLG